MAKIKKTGIRTLTMTAVILLLCLQTIRGDDTAMKYDRSSLAVMMVYHEEDTFGIYIKEAFESIPFPDKYDEHDFGFNVVDNAGISGVKRNGESGLIKAQYGKKLNNNDIRRNAAALEQLLNDNLVGNMLVARWFGMYADSLNQVTSNMELIKERGQYNADDIDVELARQTARGTAALSDAGEQLIGNTYVLINDMTYVTAEERAAVAKGALSILGAIGDAFLGEGTVSSLTDVGSAIADGFTGFSVKNHSYLFRLEWNDSIAAVFYDKYYMTEPDEEKVIAFYTDPMFKVKYVAHEYEFGEKNAWKGKYDRSDLVKLVCTRSMDKNIAALQLQYEDFKVKTPVYDVVKDGKKTQYAVKIGMKEGITEKSKFQVVQKFVDPDTQRTRYRYVATLKPCKNGIWDNRYMAAEEQDKGSELNYSLFKKVSGGVILPGMLVIEGRYHKIEE